MYAVWFNMYPGDSRGRWPQQLLTDRRVEHYWDEQRVLGVRLLTNIARFLDRRAEGTLTPEADALWDAFFVYAPGTEWTDPFPPPRSWGYPIMVTRERLRQDFEALTR